MVKDIILPDLGEGIEGAEVSEVSVKTGDTVNPEDTILVLESDKASMEIPAEVNGTVKEISVEPGDELKTGQLIMKIEIVDGILLINERMHEYNDSFKFPLNLSNNVNQWILTNDQYFVIGDNILSSTDSRNYGLVKKSQISYKFICKMWY